MYQNSSIPKFLITNICNQLKPIFKTILSLELVKFVINQVVLHYGAQEKKSPNDNTANKLKSWLVSQEIYATLRTISYRCFKQNITYCDYCVADRVTLCWQQLFGRLLRGTDLIPNDRQLFAI